MNVCRSCGQPIVWVKLKSGKANPCDPQKHSICTRWGKEMTIVTEDGRVVSGTPVALENADATGYISHFATCPNASKWRKRG